MKRQTFMTRCAALLGVSLYISISLSADWNNKLVIYPLGADLSRAQAAGDYEAAEDDTGRSGTNETGTSQNIRNSNGVLTARYEFINFNRDKLNISFGMTAGEYRAYISGYGYTDAEVAALRKWRDQAHNAEWAAAMRKNGQAAAEKAIKDVALDYDAKLRGLLLSRGFALRTGNIVECDMRVIVRRNIPVLKPMALAFQQLSAESGYDSEETVGAVLSMAQTAIRYKIPPMMEGQNHTGGLLPPAKALLKGWGDCDTKTGVVAAILGNWDGMRLVGIAVPGHYLMAIRRIPAKGDMFVTHNGLEYVLIEPAGPAWLQPGTVSANTVAMLESSDGYAVEPFF